jgi:hypothetical protein
MRLNISSAQALCVLGVMLAACGSAAGSGTSGVEGLVTTGPNCPNAQQITSCPDQPVSAKILVLDGSGHQVTNFTSDSAGHFKVDLSPGTYTLQAVRANGPPGVPAPSLSVTVTAGSYVSVHLSIDTGIR